MSPSVSPSARRRVGALLAAASVGTTLLIAPGAASAAAGGAKPFYAGTAYGSTVALGTLVKSGTTALLPMCTATTPTVKTIHTAAVTLPSVGTIGAVDTTTAAVKSSTAVAAATRSVTAETSLLGGLVTLSAVNAYARSRHTSAGYTLDTSLSVLGLKIGGVPVPTTNPAPNTTFAIPGLGSLQLNTVAKNTSAGQHAVSVTAIKITIGSNLLGVPAGKIVIGYARASLHDPVHTSIAGSAYGTQINLGNGVVKSGPTAPAYLPCGGSSSKLLVNATAAVSVPSVISAGAVRSSVVSFDSATKTQAITANRLAKISLFGGVVKLDALTTRAVVTRTAKTITRADTGTSFVGLTVSGKTYGGNVPPNTTYSLPGLGTLYVNRQIKTANGLRVYGLQIVLGAATGGLPAGATITIGSAITAVAPR